MDKKQGIVRLYIDGIFMTDKVYSTRKQRMLIIGGWCDLYHEWVHKGLVSIGIQPYSLEQIRMGKKRILNIKAA